MWDLKSRKGILLYVQTLWTFLKWRFGFGNISEDAPLDVPPYVPKYAQSDLDKIRNPDSSKIQITWVGHATFLIQVAGVNVLTDPIWSNRASPIRFFGPRRHARTGIAFEDLPNINIVLISHTHYDHLDRSTVLRLGNAPRYFVPTHSKQWFEDEGITNIAELSWWESTNFGMLTISGVPAMHWSKRRLFRAEQSGWCGYVLDSPIGSIYFAGDTGYHSNYFKEIGKKFPNILLGLIPIGAYYPRAIFGKFHIDPHEAVIVHQEIGAERSIGMHWGVFKLTQEPLGEPPLLLAREVMTAALPPEEFSTMEIGETRILSARLGHTEPPDILKE